MTANDLCPQCGGAVEAHRGPARLSPIHQSPWREGYRCLECAWGLAQPFKTPTEQETETPTS